MIAVREQHLEVEDKDLPDSRISTQIRDEIKNTSLALKPETGTANILHIQPTKVWEGASLSFPLFLCVCVFSRVTYLH